MVSATYFQMILEKMKGISQMHYLVKQREDVESSLFHVLGTGHWGAYPLSRPLASTLYLLGIQMAPTILGTFIQKNSKMIKFC